MVQCQSRTLSTLFAPALVVVARDDCNTSRPGPPCPTHSRVVLVIRSSTNQHHTATHHTVVLCLSIVHSSLPRSLPHLCSSASPHSKPCRSAESYSPPTDIVSLCTTELASFLPSVRLSAQ